MDHFTEATENTNLTHIWEKESNNNAQEKYTSWSKETMNIVRTTCKKNKKQKRERKEIRIMRRKRKKLKDQLRKEKSSKAKDILKIRREMIQRHIVRSQMKESERKVTSVAKKIMEKGIFNRAAYWDFMKSVSNKRTVKGAAVNDADGKRIDEPAKIKGRYREYFEELLTIRKAETDEEKTFEITVDKCIEAMQKKAEKLEIQPVTDAEYEDMKKSLKKDKAPDMDGWFYEIITYMLEKIWNKVSN